MKNRTYAFERNSKENPKIKTSNSHDFMRIMDNRNFKVKESI